MSGQQYQIRGDTRANVELATPAARELGVVTDKNELVIGDGATAGGLPLQRKNYAEALAPSQITSDQNNYSPTSYDRHCGALLLNTDAKRRITGLAGGSTNRVMFIVNTGSQQIVLSDADTNSTAANRFDLNGDLTLLAKGGIKLFYNATSSRWQRTSGGNKFSTIPEEFLLTGVISPSQITSDQNDYAPTSVTLATTLRLNTDASRNITGLVDPRDGAVKTILNVGSFNIVLKDASASSTAANRFSFGADVTLATKQSATVRYDATDSRWKLIASTAGGGVAAGAVIASTLATSAIGVGPIVNGYLDWSVSGSALTVALKTLAGTDPSASDPVWVETRSATVTDGKPAFLSVTAALSATLSSGSSAGTVNSTAFGLWALFFNDGGTARIGLVNTVSGVNIMSLGAWGIASSTAEGGAGAADSAQTIYTGSAVTAKGYTLLGKATWETGLATAGTWSAGPTRAFAYGPGVPLPNQIVQDVITETGAVATGTTLTPVDDTIPQNTEGDQYFSQAITPNSATNLLEATCQTIANSNQATNIATMALHQDSTASAISATTAQAASANLMFIMALCKRFLAATTSATTLKIRIGGFSAGTLTINGQSSNRYFGGVMNSFLRVREIMT